MMSDATWHEGEYSFMCSGHSVEKDHRVWGTGVIYDKDRIYILCEEATYGADGSKTSHRMCRIVPETLCVTLSKRTENFVDGRDGLKHHIYERIGPM